MNNNNFILIYVVSCICIFKIEKQLKLNYLNKKIIKVTTFIFKIQMIKFFIDKISK
jgi:hypothetical protein